MSPTEVEKINRFLADTLMADVVRKAITGSFLKRREGDIYTKAAERIALDLLDEAWHELEMWKKKEPAESRLGNVGI